MTPDFAKLSAQVAKDPLIRFHKHIMRKRQALPAEEIEKFLKDVNSLGAWATSFTGGGMDTDYRSNTEFHLTRLTAEYPQLKQWDDMVFRALNTAVSEYQACYGNQFVYEDEGYSILRYKDSQKYDLHTDSSKQNARLVSALVYLSEDFEGGETEFPAQDLKVKPEAGMICLFPSIYTHPHASLPVSNGTKYVIVTWFRGF